METVNADERSYDGEIAEVSPLNVIPPASPASTSSAVENAALPKSNASQKIRESAAKCRQYVDSLSPSVKIQKLNMLSLIREVAYPAKTIQTPMCLKSWNLILGGVKPETIGLLHKS